MSDVFGLPSPDERTRIFPAFSASASQTFATYYVPRGAQALSIFLVGGAGSGAGGTTGAAGSARSGGGGGGAGAVTRVWIPTILLPDMLYVHVGVGGAAPAGNAAGNAGVATWVSIRPSSAAAVLVGLANNGTGGAVAGTVGSPGTASNETAAWYMRNGVFVSSQGTAAGAGGANTGAVGSNVLATLSTCGGAGGGGTPTGNTNFAGGDQTQPTADFFPLLSGGTAGGGNGADGLWQLKPFQSRGGAGGGTNGAAGTGGSGGNGGVGSGGGGGGGGVTGGAGGKGGDGLCIITALF